MGDHFEEILEPQNIININSSCYQLNCPWFHKKILDFERHRRKVLDVVQGGSGRGVLT